MLKLYFGNISSIISTLLIIIFGIFFWQVLLRREHITKWGILVLVLFFFGMFMSMMSGTKDGIGGPQSVIPLQHWMMALLCILGGIAVLAGILALIIRRQEFRQISFYILSSVIIVKTVLTEGFRLADYFHK